MFKKRIRLPAAPALHGLKKLVLAALFCLMLLLSCAQADTVTYNKQLTVDTSAEYVDFGDVHISDWTTVGDFLHKLPNLKRCDMFGTYIYRKYCDQLAAEFPDVEFGWTIRFGTPDCWHVVRTDQTAFSTLHSSRSPEHTSEQFSVLKYCKKLKALDIGHNQATDISWLENLPELRVLIIALNHIEDISALEKLPKLEYLEIFHNSISDLSPLKNLTHLMDISLGYNSITDVSVLTELEHLKRVWCYHANYYRPWGEPADLSEAQVSALRKALPAAHIDSVSDPTLNGWRSGHPHYLIIAEIFRTGKYIPFADSFDDPAPAPDPAPAGTADDEESSRGNLPEAAGKE